MYLKENPNQAHHASLFEMCQSKILQNKVRLKCSKIRDLIMQMAAGIHNLRNMFRKPLLNYS